METRVKLSKDGSSIDFTASDNLPTSLKKFRQSPEIEGFYRFIFENDLQKEAFEILERIIQGRKAKKAQAAKADGTANTGASKSANAKTAKAPGGADKANGAGSQKAGAKSAANAGGAKVKASAAPAAKAKAAAPIAKSKAPAPKAKPKAKK